MKKYLSILMVLCSVLIITGTSWGLTINAGVTNVGALDYLEDDASLQYIKGFYGINQQDDATLAWVRDVLDDPTVTFDNKNEDMDGAWSIVDSYPLVWAIPLSYSPEYFLLKTGNIADNTSDLFLYKNLAELSWAVIDLGALSRGIVEITKISHVNEYNGTAVPEPTTMLLLGLGLLGLAGVRRKIKK